MNNSELRDIVVPLLKSFCGGIPVIEADGNGTRPSGKHATYKVISPYIKDRGRAEEVPDEDVDGKFIIRHNDTNKVVFSFTAISLDNAESVDLAIQMHRWFAFYGFDQLSAQQIAIVEIGEVVNRDVFVVDGSERRNGFDVTFRISTELTVESVNIEHVDLTRE